MITRLTFNEVRNKFGLRAKRTHGYRVTDEFGLDLSKQVKVMSMGGGLYAIDKFGADITNRVKIEKN